MLPHRCDLKQTLNSVLLLDINIQYQLEMSADKNVYFSELQKHVPDLPVHALLHLHPHLSSECKCKYRNMENCCVGFKLTHSPLAQNISLNAAKENKSQSAMNNSHKLPVYRFSIVLDDHLFTWIY